MTITLHMLAFVSGFCDVCSVIHTGCRILCGLWEILLVFLIKTLWEKSIRVKKKRPMPKWYRHKDDATIRSERGKGILLVICVLAATADCLRNHLFGSLRNSPNCWFVVEAIMTYQILAARCLQKESTKVYTALKKNDLLGARYAVSMIVGRDTNVLDEAGVARAAVETVAESTSDGVIAPMLYTAWPRCQHDLQSSQYDGFNGRL